MRKSLLLIALIVATSSLALAAGPIGFGVQGIYANYSAPGDMKDFYGAGYGGGVHLDVNFIPMLDLRISGDYMSFSMDQDKFRSAVIAAAGNPSIPPSDIQVDGGRLSLISATVNLKYNVLPLPVVTPYLTGGIGIAAVSVSDLTVKYQGVTVPGTAGMKTESRTQVNVGGGVNFSLGVAALYVEAKYSVILTEGDKHTFVPITVGLTF